MNANSKEHEELRKAAEDYMDERGIIYLHITTAIVRMIGGKFLCLPVPGAKGWPDHICFPGNDIVFFVEYKTGTGQLKPEQRDIRDRLQAADYGYFVCHNLNETIRIIKAWTKR
jgi:hypothetical protein